MVCGPEIPPNENRAYLLRSVAKGDELLCLEGRCGSALASEKRETGYRECEPCGKSSIRLFGTYFVESGGYRRAALGDSTRVPY